MRLLVDEHGLDWDEAWGDHAADAAATRTTRCCPRRSRSGRCRCSPRLLPRHLEIIYEINRRFLDEVRARFPGDESAAAAPVDHRRDRRAAPCAWRTWPAVGSHAINGVAALHTELLKQTVLRDFHAVCPGEVPQRHQRRDAAALDGAEQPAPERAHHRGIWRRLDGRPRAELTRLEPLAADAGFRREWRAVKAREQAVARGADPGAHRYRRRSGVAVRHPGQAAARVQAAAPQRAAT